MVATISLFGSRKEPLDTCLSFSVSLCSPFFLLSLFLFFFLFLFHSLFFSLSLSFFLSFYVSLISSLSLSFPFSLFLFLSLFLCFFLTFSHSHSLTHTCYSPQPEGDSQVLGPLSTAQGIASHAPFFGSPAVASMASCVAIATSVLVVR